MFNGLFGGSPTATQEAPSGGFSGLFAPQRAQTKTANIGQQSEQLQLKQQRQKLVQQAQQATSQVAKNTTHGFSMKDLGTATRDVGVGVARFPLRSAAGLANTAASSVGLPTKETPNKLGRFLLGTEPTQSSQERGAGAAAAHPAGFRVPGINKTLSPATTGASETGLSFLQDILGAKGGVKAPIKAVSKFNATTTAAKGTAKNVAVNEPSPAPAEAVPKSSATPVKTQIKPAGQGALPKTNAKTIASKTPVLKPGEEGSVAPGAVASDVKDFITKTKANVTESKAAGSSAKDVGDKLFALKQNHLADQQALTEFTKGTEKFAPKDLEAAYHYAEDKTSPVTDTQKQIHDQYVKPLIDATNESKAKLKAQGVELPSDNYIHRIAVDKGTGLERFLQGDSGSPRTGSILRKTTPSSQRRVMYAATDESGNRTVVAIKGAKNELGNVTGPKQVTAFMNGKGQDLGPVKLESPLTGNLNGKTFTGKDGKAYTIGNATTKEIEANSNVKYYKNPIVNSALDYVNTRNAERANQFLNDWKTSPEFKNIAIKEGAGRVPEGWKSTQAPQFRGYYFHPKVSEALDDFSPGKGSDPLAAIEGMNRFLRNSIFFNPLIHIPNVTTAWATSRGLSGFTTPKGIVSLAKDFPKAINEVVHQGPLYQKLLREGAPFMHFDQEQFSHQITKMMENRLKDPKISDQVTKALGYANPKKLIGAFYSVSHKATWYSNDIFTMQRILEEMRKGQSATEAIKTAGDYLPNYRLPTRFLGNRGLKQTISNPNITMFANYHYGILRAYGNMVRELVGKDASIKDRAGAVDKLLIGGLIGLVGYPALDKLDRKITGNPNASQRRAGPFTIPSAIGGVIQHKPNATTGSAVQKAITPGVTLNAVHQLINNKDFFGNQIYDKNNLTKNPKAASKELGSFALGTVAPVAQGQKLASGKQSTKSFLGGLLGISQPKSTPLGNKVSNLLNQQLGSSGMTIQQQYINDQKNKARQQIASGKGNSMAKTLLSQGVIANDAKLKVFETQAKWTSTQRAFNSLSPTNKLQIINNAKPEEINQLIADKPALIKTLQKTTKSKTAKTTTVQAAKELLKKLGS